MCNICKNPECIPIYKIHGYDLQVVAFLAPEIITVSGRKEEMDKFIKDFNADIGNCSKP